MSMDITTVSVGSATRDGLAEYRDRKDLPNMDIALQTLLEDEKGGNEVSQ